MSIIAAATTQPLEPTPAVLFGALISAIAVIVVAFVAKVFRPGALSLPDRLPLEKSGLPLFVVMIAGVGAWFGSATVFVAIRVFQSMNSTGGQPTEGFSEKDLTAADIAFIATVPPTLGFLVLWAGDRLIRRTTPISRLGYDLAKVGRGVKLGLLAMVFTTPLMYALMVALEQFYGLIEFEHPKEHMLLKVLGETSTPMLRTLIVLGAVVGAPLCEELLFRAHLQTLIRRVCLWMAGQRAPEQSPHGFPPSFQMPLPATALPPGAIPPPGASAIGAMPGFGNVRRPLLLSSPVPFATATSLPYSALSPDPDLTVDRPQPTIPAWPGWVAILITSLIFAVVHEIWSAPLIFALSICFGYAYERTNNLWVSITMHAIFNGLNTALFLGGVMDS